MTQHDRDFTRLVPLLSAGEDIDNLEDAKLPLLNLCVQKSIGGYLRVPPGHVAVIYRYVKKEPSRSLFGAGKLHCVSKRRPEVARQVRFVALDVADIQEIRDAGSTAIEGFLHGGLEAVRDGLLPMPFEYAVVQKDHPNAFAADRGFRAETLLEGQVYPITTALTSADILVTVEDAKVLQDALGALSFKDKWGHKDAAPIVYLVYRASQDPYDRKEIVRTLIADDKAKIHNRAIANTVAYILKVDVRKIAESELAVEQISHNKMGKDYAEPGLSRRMSLLLLATDCWIHDEEIRRETNHRIAMKQRETDLLLANPLLNQKQRNVLTGTMIVFKANEEASIASRLFMPAGLKTGLRGLGFSSNQADHLYFVITQAKTGGGRHVATEKAAAEGLKRAKSRRVRNLSGSRLPSPP